MFYFTDAAPESAADCRWFLPDFSLLLPVGIRCRFAGVRCADYS